MERPEGEVESGGSGESFEDAASRVSETEKPPENPVSSVEEPEKEHWLDEEWAIIAVQGCFYPLKKYDHASWEVSEEQARLVSPYMQSALEELIESVPMPSFLKDFVNKNKKTSKLLGAMAMLFFIKRAEVRKAKKAEEARAKEQDIPLRPVESQSGAPAYTFHVPEKKTEPS